MARVYRLYTASAVPAKLLRDLHLILSGRKQLDVHATGDECFNKCWKS